MLRIGTRHVIIGHADVKAAFQEICGANQVGEEGVECGRRRGRKATAPLFRC